MSNINILVFILFTTIIGTYGNQTSNLHIKINGTSTNTTTINIPLEGGTVAVSEKSKKVENTLLKPSVNITANNATVHNVTLLGREGVKVTSTTSTPVIIANTTLKTTTTEKIIPVSESVASPTVNATNKTSSSTEKLEVIGDSKVKPRKGAPEYIPENITSSTTRKPKKMKPTVTVGSDDDGNVFLGHRNSKKDNSSILKTEGILSGKYKPDYVLPIVMTILAVPLLAIIIAVLYKRGAEWWQHRHYRRMDFLIDGMYNN